MLDHRLAVGDGTGRIVGMLSELLDSNAEIKQRLMALERTTVTQQAQ